MYLRVFSWYFVGVGTHTCTHFLLSLDTNQPGHQRAGHPGHTAYPPQRRAGAPVREAQDPTKHPQEGTDGADAGTGRAGPGRAGARARRASTPFLIYGQELFSKHSSSARALFLVAAEWRIGARTADGRPVVQWQEDGSVNFRRVCVCPEALAVNTPPPPVLTTFRSLAINRNPRGPLFPLHLSRNMHPAALPTGI